MPARPFGLYLVAVFQLVGQQAHHSVIEIPGLDLVEARLIGIVAHTHEPRSRAIRPIGPKVLGEPLARKADDAIRSG